MPNITRAFAFANNEVAFLAWDLDVDAIPGCLGFEIIREYLDASDKVTYSKPLAAYVAFKGQSNPDWLPQNTTVWPVQKFTWRDLTLRRRRDEATLHRLDERVRYRIRAVGQMNDQLEAVQVIQETHKDKEGKRLPNTYQGKAIPLGYLTEPAFTNPVEVTAKRKPFTSTFTNGILSTQFLLKALSQDGKIEEGELEARLRDPADPLRKYLTGDVVQNITDFFTTQNGGRFHAALYELEDVELVNLLVDNAQRISLILSDAGSSEAEDEDGGKSTEYDTRNEGARKTLRKIAKAAGSAFTLQDRMFNGSGHIGHNKFVVHVDGHGKAKSVLTGSTNWTWSGVSGQSNNCIRIDDEAVAEAYLAYWNRLEADVQPTPKPLSSKNPGARQGDELKEANTTSTVLKMRNGGTIETWFSPNVPGKNQPPGPKTIGGVEPPPDMARLFSLMRLARRSIFFLVFMPSRGGLHSIVSKAVELGMGDPTLEVIGAISDTQAMWGYEASIKDSDGTKEKAYSPHVFQKAGISVVRATALTDKEIGKSLGNFQMDEKLTVGRAIIHDKILVLDPMDPVNCVVAFGSHNLGYKASYANDENLVIVRGHQDLALAYAAHVLDVYDHYRFRAVLAEGRNGRNGESQKFDGFLTKSDSWQEKSSRRLARYFTRP